MPLYIWVISHVQMLKKMGHHQFTHMRMHQVISTKRWDIARNKQLRSPAGLNITTLLLASCKCRSYSWWVIVFLSCKKYQWSKSFLLLIFMKLWLLSKWNFSISSKEILSWEHNLNHCGMCSVCHSYVPLDLL